MEEIKEETTQLGKFTAARFDSDGDLEIIDHGDVYSSILLKPDEYLNLRNFINNHIRTLNQIRSFPKEKSRIRTG